MSGVNQRILENPRVLAIIGDESPDEQLRLAQREALLILAHAAGGTLTVDTGAAIGLTGTVAYDVARGVIEVRASRG